MRIDSKPLMRTLAAGAASLVTASAGLVLVTSGPAQAAPRCSNGRPTTGAGSFKNNTDQTIMVKGDKHLGNNRYKTVELAVGRNGGTASSLCDVDFIKTFHDWSYDGIRIDGDNWQKIILSWKCWNTPNSAYRIACGGN
ncbi:hypothetical protein Aut01nite_05200 [Actinoplanes utahensis]|nr:hypothetical protein Aut01nite_05200 [Actinoplanes utahensis]